MQTKIAGQAKTLTTGFIFNGNSLVEVAKLHASIPPLTKEASSNEIKQPSNSTNTDVPIVEPPYDLASLAALYEKSPREGPKIVRNQYAPRRVDFRFRGARKHKARKTATRATAS